MLRPMSRPTAMVTGPTAGIGRSFAAQLAASGHDLVLVARNRERLEKVAAELRQRDGAEVEVIVADLGDRSQLATVEARLGDRTRPGDLLVNNAGFGLRRGFLDTTREGEQSLPDVRVRGVRGLTRPALEPMVERGSGAIVNVSSVA